MPVFVLDKRKRPLMPCTEKRARQLLDRGRAVVHTTYPFTIRLRDRIGGETQHVEIRLDPGSKSTGVAVVRRSRDGDHVLHLAQIDHRGYMIKNRMTSRAALRRSRRLRKTRCRPVRFNNRARSIGWLPPSLQHRVDVDLSYTYKLLQRLPTPTCSVEFVKFDTQLMQNENISGIEYQKGELAGYEIKEYLLEKWNRTCVYCGCIDQPLQIDHVIPRSRGGSNRISNLTLACRPCNQRKNNTRVQDFLKNQPTLLKKILSGLKTPLRDAAAMNSTRFALLARLQDLFGHVEKFTGGHTKFVRENLHLPKSHAIDAACAGNMSTLAKWDVPVFLLTSTGRGMRQCVIPNKFGFARSHRPKNKNIKGFTTGDIVRATVCKGKQTGIWTGRVVVRTRGSFDIFTKERLIQSISYKNCVLIQRNTGYKYCVI